MWGRWCMRIDRTVVGLTGQPYAGIRSKDATPGSPLVAQAVAIVSYSYKPKEEPFIPFIERINITPNP